ncbi:formate dehydrogenase accessory sulfurtransferase FdhD [Cereibacter changlensis]|uniref:formate dehydrogenase accessory sulfurtransferase FdhD n=1 Tax=Cereibacter changlensis TaxID=402884 RepID=UPI0040337DDB
MMETRQSLPRLALTAGPADPGQRMLPEEVAVALSYNGSTQAVMMASPEALEDFAYGFSLTEGLATAAEIDSVEAVETERGIDLQIWLKPEAGARLMARRRTMAGPVGCGLCGIDSLEEALREAPAVPTSALRVSLDDVGAAISALTAHQPLHDVTRAVHAAGFWTPEAGIVAAREDVGRHNALDKLAGALLRGGVDASRGAVLLTSRVSIDMVQKCARIGAPVLIAVSAPTAHAVRMAEAAGITLIGLARPDRCEVFTHSHRITVDEAEDVA